MITGDLPVPLPESIAKCARDVGIADAIADPNIESGQMLYAFARACMAPLQEELRLIRAQQVEDFKRAESAEAELSRLRAQEPKTAAELDNGEWLAGMVSAEGFEPPRDAAPPAPSQGQA